MTFDDSATGAELLMIAAAGKTTTFYMIVGLVKPEDGTVSLGDDDITELPMYRRAQRGISYLPQEASVFRKLTVEENLGGTAAGRGKCQGRMGGYT